MVKIFLNEIPNFLINNLKNETLLITFEKFYKISYISLTTTIGQHV